MAKNRYTFMLRDFRQKFQSNLELIFPTTEIDSFFFLLTESYLKKSRLDIALNPNFKISEAENALFENALNQLKKSVPIQYILGETEFFGLKFKVNDAVLIPRPETEELVEWILQDFKNSEKKLSVLDIGTGSGCIPIALAKKLASAELSAMDISENALEVARENARLNAVDVAFKLQNILETETLAEKFDIIVSNPPYVRELEKNEMSENVLKYEPKSALYVGDDDALIFYRKITKLAKNALKKNGVLYFEVNQYLGTETENLIQEFGFETQLKKDIFGNHRMIKATLKDESY
ncbi:peptide chain release factor N(5)-glutamine methyltransferase [Gramella sp. AN32]|uniref:Release factor glutamine methyltransferase n=1 Tax=Christiangramia antarctica TaxID=2058158 RepID=A0ABW5X428_9FLAO|nr:peptide chain release factor N(5)-glutamine methyltransferase [Gramella sp. AN32]